MKRRSLNIPIVRCRVEVSDRNDNSRGPASLSRAGKQPGISNCSRVPSSRPLCGGFDLPLVFIDPRLREPIELVLLLLGVVLGGVLLDPGSQKAGDPLARELRIELVDALDGLIDAEALGVWPEDLAPSRVELCVFHELPESSGDLDGGLAFLRAHPVQETINKRIVLEGMILLSRLAHTGSISPTAG